MAAFHPSDFALRRQLGDIALKIPLAALALGQRAEPMAIRQLKTTQRGHEIVAEFAVRKEQRGKIPIVFCASLSPWPRE